MKQSALLSLTAFAFAAAPGVFTLQSSDFYPLHAALRQYVKEQKSNQVIPLLVRASFHDIADFDAGQAGGQGCLVSQPVLNFPQNGGLSSTINNLFNFVNLNFPNNKFTAGDVISLAGKVSAEMAFGAPVAWSFGRSVCNTANTEQPEAPGGNITTMSQLSPFLRRYNLTAQEMGILIAGGHGMGGAMANVTHNGFGTHLFNEITCGIQWIGRTMLSSWITNISSAGQPQFIHNFTTNVTINATATVPIGSITNMTFLRLPIDFAFFPTALQKMMNATQKAVKKGIQSPPVFNLTIDTAFKPVEDYLSYIHNNSFPQKERVFSAAFAPVYAKMLKIGSTNLQPYTDPYTLVNCTTYDALVNVNCTKVWDKGFWFKTVDPNAPKTTTTTLIKKTTTTTSKTKTIVTSTRSSQKPKST